MLNNLNVKKIFSLGLILSLLLNTSATCLARGLDKQENEFYETQTGSYLHAAYPLLKPKAAVKAAIDHVVSHHKTYIDDNFINKGIIVFDYNNKEQQIEKLYKNVKSLLQNEIRLKDTHSIFYHGHLGAMSSYYDILHEFMEISGIKSLKNLNPLHYKSPELNKIFNVDQFFDKNQYLKAHIDQVKQIKAEAIKNYRANPLDPDNIANYQKAKDLKPFNSKKNLGVGKAPDSTNYARDHLKCVNLSLFGNSENIFESSFLFFLTSGNIATLDRFLTERLFKQVGLLSNTASADEINQKLTQYENIFTSKMGQAGGGMMQIAMKNNIVDKYSFASWAKGVPYLMNKKTGKFATRGHNNRAVPVLNSKSKNLELPSLREIINLYKKDPYKLSRKFSYDGQTNLMHLDRIQARLFINPKIFADKNLVSLKRIYRHKVDPATQKTYKHELRAQMVNDMIDAVNKKQFTKEFYDQKFSFGKLVKFVFSSHNKMSDIVDIALNASRELFSEVFNIIKIAVSKIQNVNALVVKKIEALNTVEVFKNKVKNVALYAKKFITKAFKAFR